MGGEDSGVSGKQWIVRVEQWSGWESSRVSEGIVRVDENEREKMNVEGDWTR